MQRKIMTHIVAGYPTLKKSEEIVVRMVNCGVDFIEIQIPFSDPVADGPVIMWANQKALENGIKVEDCFKLMKKLARKFSINPKFLFMSYFNILHHYGVEKFCKKAKECGCYGLIIPDMPVDEEKYDHYLASCKKYKLMPILIISPLTTAGRLKKLAKYTKGFVYCVSRYGTTGQSKNLNPHLAGYLKKVRTYIKLPLAVGFGISKKEHTEAVWKHAEIAVIGSKIIEMVDKGERFEELLSAPTKVGATELLFKPLL